MPDTNGFDEFYLSTRGRILQYLYAVSGDLGDAQDAAQEAYARAWQRWNEVGRCTDPEGWIRVVGWRVLANGWRKIAGRRVAYRRHGVAEPSPAPSADTVTLVNALRQIPVDQRIAIVMHHLLGLPVAVVAAQTGAPVGTVKARLSRGREILATLLRSDDEGVNHV